MSATDAASLSTGSKSSRLVDFLLSSIGAKFLMAISGAGLWAYLILHMAGNLPILFDRDAFNRYAHLLQSTPLLLWTQRVLIFGGMAVHAWAGLRLTRLNREARGIGYTERKRVSGTLASSTMIISGVVILAFFVFHILHFTTRSIGFATFAVETLPDGSSRADAALMVNSAFSQLPIVAIYVIGQVLVFTHLIHGSISLFQSVGAFPLFAHPGVKWIARILVALLVGVAISIPLSIYF